MPATVRCPGCGTITRALEDEALGDFQCARFGWVSAGPDEDEDESEEEE